MKFSKTGAPKMSKMNWKQAKKKFPKLKARADADFDGVMNKKDCRPFNFFKQHVTVYHGTTKDAGDKIQKEGIKKGIGVNPYVYVTPNKKTAVKYSAGGVVFKLKLEDKTIKKAVGRLKDLPNEITIAEDIHKNKIKEITRA